MTETEMQLLIGSELTARDGWTAASGAFHRGCIDPTADHDRLLTRRREASAIWSHATEASNEARRQFIETDGAVA